jgi:hypothetical protein
MTHQYHRLALRVYVWGELKYSALSGRDGPEFTTAPVRSDAGAEIV